jgi:hypothetical protein
MLVLVEVGFVGLWGWFKLVWVSSGLVQVLFGMVHTDHDVVHANIQADMLGSMWPMLVQAKKY